MLKIMVPATSANIGPGFDCLGFALNLYNKFYIEKIDSGIDVSILDNNTGNNLELPLEDNLFYKGVKKIYDEIDMKIDGLRLNEEINIPFARGLGSSASAVVAGLVGGNKLTGNQISEERIIELAVEMEGHPDNVLPALKGGYIINVFSQNGLIYKKLQLDEEIQFLIIIPDFKLKTEEVRRVLPTDVSFNNAVFNLSRTALLTACLMDKDYDKLKIAMEDKLHQDYRSVLIPGFQKVMETAYEKGALGVSLSGSGPSLLAIVNKDASTIGEVMVEEFKRNGISSLYIIKNIDNDGCKIIS